MLPQLFLCFVICILSIISRFWPYINVNLCVCEKLYFLKNFAMLNCSSRHVLSLRLLETISMEFFQLREMCATNFLQTNQNRWGRSMKGICSIAREKFIFPWVVTLVNRNEIPSASNGGRRAVQTARARHTEITKSQFSSRASLLSVRVSQRCVSEGTPSATLSYRNAHLTHVKERFKLMRRETGANRRLIVFICCSKR
jgi:hypothetical protein